MLCKVLHDYGFDFYLLNAVLYVIIIYLTTDSPFHKNILTVNCYGTEFICTLDITVYLSVLFFSIFFMRWFIFIFCFLLFLILPTADNYQAESEIVFFA